MCVNNSRGLAAFRLICPFQVPNVISTSYGEPEYSVPEYYMRRVCQLFGEVSARGTTLLFSSGDDGVADFEDGCPGPNNSTRFAPSFPASCPYVTAVGGTESKLTFAK